MKKLIVWCSALTLLLAPSLAFPKSVAVTGDYTGQATSPKGSKEPIEGRLIQEGAKVSGEFVVVYSSLNGNKVTSHFDFEKGSLVGNKLKLKGKSGKSLVISGSKSATLPPSNIAIELEGTVSGNSISGRVAEASGARLFEFKINKQP